MFDYTTSAIEIILKDVKRLSYIATLVSSFVIGSYYVYAAIAGIGRLYFTIPLASISLGYFIFLIISVKVRSIRTKKNVSLIYRFTRLAMNAVILGFTIYEIYLAATQVDGITIVWASISLVIFLTTLILNIAVLIIEPRARLLSAAVMKDLEDDVFRYINKINWAKGDEQVSFDLSGYEKELATLQPMVDEKEAKRKKNRKETWDRRLPFRKLFRFGKKKKQKEEVEVEIIEPETIKKNKR